MKPKINKGYNTGTYDECQTPPYALDPLIPYLKSANIQLIWEPAVGKGCLAQSIINAGFDVVCTDIQYGDEWDFLRSVPLGRSMEGQDWNMTITNPPYSIKYEWLEKCYELDHPFALLMPVEMLGTAKGQRLFDKYGIEVIFMSPRVDFLMPYALWTGHGAQFPTAWFTWKLNLPQQINYAKIAKPPKKDLSKYWEKSLGKEEFKETLLRSWRHYFELD